MCVENCRTRKVKTSISELHAEMDRKQLYEHQLSFHTEVSLKYLSFIGYKEVTL